MNLADDVVNAHADLVFDVGAVHSVQDVADRAVVDCLQVADERGRVARHLAPEVGRDAFEALRHVARRVRDLVAGVDGGEAVDVLRDGHGVRQHHKSVPGRVVA